MYSSHLVIIFITIQGLSCLQEDYYWREYTGSIPEDAIVAAQDINGKDIFIGQAYVHDEGLIVTEIHPGQKTVHPAINGVRNIDSYIKILCGVQENFYWALANATHLNVQLINKRPIIGGHEVGGTLYVGRVNHEGHMTIGKVVAFRGGEANAKLWFAFKGKEIGIDNYEVLLYSDVGVDVRYRSNI